MEDYTLLDVPSAWEQIPVSGLRGTIMVIGAPDVGKSTFAHYLFRRLKYEIEPDRETLQTQKPLQAKDGRIAYLDGDPGQGELGPPTTMTLCFNFPAVGHLPRVEDVRRYSIGSTSPRGHMLPMLVGAFRLIQFAFEAGSRCLVYDTSGLIDPSQGGQALKQAKVELLQPVVLIAIQREKELEPILMPLRRSCRVKLIVLEPSQAVSRRDGSRRQNHRRDQFARYFAPAHSLVVEWKNTAVFPLPRFTLNRLVALEDAAGFTLGLGIVSQIDRLNKRVTLQTPLPDLKGVNALRLGDIALDPHSFREIKLGS
jgi:polynucleotide 5'-hydroxyl-kinase GRC3/NOL9